MIDEVLRAHGAVRDDESQLRRPAERPLSLAFAVLNVHLMTAVSGCCLLLGVLFDHLGRPESVMDLVELARRVREGDKSKLDRYKELVASQDDVELLKQVADSNWQEDEISIPAYERALQINPNQAEILASLGLIKYLIGEDAEAFQCLEKARRISPEGLQVLTLQAAFEKRPEKQVKLYRKMLQLDPSNRVALQNLERLEASQGR